MKLVFQLMFLLRKATDDNEVVFLLMFLLRKATDDNEVIVSTYVFVEKNYR